MCAHRHRHDRETKRQCGRGKEGRLEGERERERGCGGGCGGERKRRIGGRGNSYNTNLHVWLLDVKLSLRDVERAAWRAGASSTGKWDGWLYKQTQTHTHTHTHTRTHQKKQRLQITMTFQLYSIKLMINIPVITRHYTSGSELYSDALQIRVCVYVCTVQDGLQTKYASDMVGVSLNSPAC